MSFSRAALKRFNDNTGCAPPPGSYDIKSEDLRGAASFDKSDRFKAIKAAALPPPSPSRSVLVSPVRRTMSVDGLVEGSNTKKEKNGVTMSKKQQKLLETEIRSLVQQRGEQDRRLLVLEEELKKVEAKLLAAVREKTSLTANVTTLERQRVELKKVNEFLKSKASADTTKKRINSLTMELMEARNTLDVKNKEFSVLQINSEGKLKVLESDLQASRSTVTALKDRNKDLEILHQVSKTQNGELQNENDKLHTSIKELKEEMRVLQEYLDTANDQIQDLRLNLREKTKENTVAVSLVDKIKQLENELEQRTAELESTRDALRHKEEEAEEYKSQQNYMVEQVSLANQKVEDSWATIRQQEAELARLREVLRRTEKELDERVAHLEQRYLFSEEERSKTQEQGLRRVEELKTELLVLKEANRDEKKKQILLEEKLPALTEELTKQKALADSLYVLLEQEREESEEQIRQLKEEMEEVLGELALLEEKEQEFQRLQEENNVLGTQLSDARTLLESKSDDVAALKDEHSTTVRQLEEKHTSSVSKMTDIVTELESTKEALKGAEESQKALEAEVTRVTQQMEEEMRKVAQQKQEEINRVKEELEEHRARLLAEAKARDENSRMLQEVQFCLAQKEAEISAMEVSHAALISQLQLQVKESEEALGQLEQQRGQSVAELQTEKEKAQKWIKEATQEKEEIIQQLQQEQAEKDTIQVALQEERGALEVERNDHQQTRSEMLRLQTQLEQVDKESKSLMSQVQLKQQSRLALENQLNAAEQERNHLKSRLEEAEQKDLNLQAQLELTEEQTRVMQCELEEHQQDRRALLEQVQVLTQEKVTLQWEMEEQRQQLQRQITEAQEKSSSSSETEHWKEQYEELFSKVKPFQEQLNAFAAERNALLNENGANQEELNKLSDAYASLLGHQNQKQKIKHVIKLKDENISLKQEISKLRSQVNRQKSDLEQLKSKLPGAPRRRFDPSKAFQHNKENETSEPLKEGNHFA